MREAIPAARWEPDLGHRQPHLPPQPDGHPLSWVGQFQDITERKERKARLQALAHRDPLTGIFNRRWFESKLEGLIEEGRAGAVVLVDLDDCGFEVMGAEREQVGGVLRRAVRLGHQAVAAGGVRNVHG